MSVFTDTEMLRMLHVQPSRPKGPRWQCLVFHRHGDVACASCPTISNLRPKGPRRHRNPRKIVARCKMMLFVLSLMIVGSYRRHVVDEEIVD